MTGVDGHFPLTTKEGWAAFVARGPSAVQLVPDRDWRRQSPADREEYDRSRFEHHARLIVVATPTVRQVTHTGRRLVLLNRGQISARRGIIITGAAGTGKTTAVTQLGLSHELRARRRRTGGEPFLPVVYVTVPPAATAKMLAAEFARFAGLPIPSAFNQASITNAVCDVLGKLGTELVIVDELQNLNLATRAGAETSDQLKYLSERIPATFVYAGLDVEDNGLFTGPRGKQIAGRFAAIEAAPFGYATAGQRQDWHALLATLDEAIRLHRHKPGALLEHAAYLHQRTAGMIGSLSHLVRETAVDAILDGTEKITKAGLERVTLDRAAETAAARHREAVRPRRKVS
ncbi:hypothetical protein ABH926_008817 [Catenulispora sp. GP43]|uniref:AAA family ATPase n=1 Tax=Catenulispora sp. GP43 TaxID=3156263 RepID=UPI003516304D